MTRAEQAARLRIAKDAGSGAVFASKPEPVKSTTPVRETPVIVVPPSVVADHIAVPSVLYPPAPAFDPADHPVSDVLAYMDANPDEINRIIMAESEGKSRKSIVARGE